MNIAGNKILKTAGEAKYSQLSDCMVSHAADFIG
jgi:hypothetical protein